MEKTISAEMQEAYEKYCKPNGEEKTKSGKLLCHGFKAERTEQNRARKMQDSEISCALHPQNGCDTPLDRSKMPEQEAQLKDGLLLDEIHFTDRTDCEPAIMSDKLKCCSTPIDRFIKRKDH